MGIIDDNRLIIAETKLIEIENRQGAYYREDYAAN